MIRERCSCGAEVEVHGEEAYDIVCEWRETHRHDIQPLDGLQTTSQAQVEQAPDYTVPELHIGFRQFDE